ncbi:MAG: response regulator [Desulfobacterium sp.]|nr:response regulator [Desulfobacterium sp.]
MGLKILVVEDDFTSRKVMCGMLSPYGDCDVAVNGKEAVQAFSEALDQGKQYDLISLDIMMPEMDGQDALKAIRRIEQERDIIGSDSVKIIMTTALSDSKNLMQAFQEQCEAYIIKPVRKEKLLEQLHLLGLVPRG